MNDRARRKDLQAQYRQTQPEAGVYAIVNARNGRVLLGSSPNLASVRHKVDFAKSTGVSSVLDQRLSKDIRQFGIDALSLEVLEVLETAPEMTAQRILGDLATLEQLWRERFDSALLY